MNKILAIKGYSTRGNEIIKILEMFGGKNTTLEGFDIHCFYYIDTYNNLMRLGHANYCNPKDFVIFTLEEFLEKYPYKVGDKVLLHNQVKVIKNIGWDSNNNEVIYTLEANINGTKTQYQVFNYDLQSYNTMPDITIDGKKLIAPKGYIVKRAMWDGNSLVVEYIKNTSKQC